MESLAWEIESDHLPKLCYPILDVVNEYAALGCVSFLLTELLTMEVWARDTILLKLHRFCSILLMAVCQDTSRVEKEHFKQAYGASILALEWDLVIEELFLTHEIDLKKIQLFWKDRLHGRLTWLEILSEFSVCRRTLFFNAIWDQISFL